MYELKIHNLKVLANQTEAFGKYHYQVLEERAWVQSSWLYNEIHQQVQQFG